MKRVSSESSLFIHDTHIPHHDPAAIKAVLELTGYMRPDTIFLNGDIIDFKPISRFTKTLLEEQTLQDDIDATVGFLTSLREASPASKMFYIQGNHEDRLRKFLLSNARALSDLRGLQLEVLLNLEELNIQLIPERRTLMHNDIAITHGDKVRTRSGYTAHAMLDKYGVSGQSGHTHRAAKVSRRWLTRSLTWVEGGCLCKLDPDYIEGVADWQQAVTVGFTMDGRTELDLLPINRGKLYFDGILFGADDDGDKDVRTRNDGAGEVPEETPTPRRRKKAEEPAKPGE